MTRFLPGAILSLGVWSLAAACSPNSGAQPALAPQLAGDSGPRAASHSNAGSACGGQPCLMAKRVGVGEGFACALGLDGSVSCLREPGALAVAGLEAGTVVTIRGVVDAVSLSVGRYHACAALRGGSVYCWGDGDLGQTGAGSQGSGQLALVAGVVQASAVATGDFHSCALEQSGRVQCWGNNAQGALGGPGGKPCRSGLECTTTAAAVSGPADYVAIAAAGAQSCGLTKHGEVRCWGALRARAARGDTLPARFIEHAESVHLGETRRCARRREELRCLDGAGGSINELRELRGLDALSFVSSNTTLGINAQHQLVLVGSEQPPAVVSGELEVQGASARGDRGCVVLGDGRLACWGFSQPGALLPDSEAAFGGLRLVARSAG